MPTNTDTELTVEAALAELRDLFPGKMIDVGLRVGPNAQYAVISVFAASFQRSAPTLAEAMQKVRAWKGQQ